MPDFSRRDTTPELMDIEAVDYPEFRGCLMQLEQANRLSLAYRPTMAFFDKLAGRGRLSSGSRVRIVDVGSGYGDMSRKIDAWASRRGIAVDIVGVDMNPWSARAAEEATAAKRPLRWVTANVFEYRPPADTDIVMSSLFTHHLRDGDVVRFINWMEEHSRIGWIINDLERHWLSYRALQIGFWATRRHRFMRHDGPVSVASAFTYYDWERLLREAGLAREAVAIEKWMPFRLSVSRIKV